MAVLVYIFLSTTVTIYNKTNLLEDNGNNYNISDENQVSYTLFLRASCLVWHLITEKLFSLPLTKVDIHFGHSRMYAMPYSISWIIFILDSEPSYTDKLLKFRWVQIAPLS